MVTNVKEMLADFEKLIDRGEQCGGVDHEEVEKLVVKFNAMIAELEKPSVPVSELDVRDRIVTFVMEHYNDTPEDGHFWFDIHDAAELLEEIDKAKGGE